VLSICTDALVPTSVITRSAWLWRSTRFVQRTIASPPKPIQIMLNHQGRIDPELQSFCIRSISMEMRILRNAFRPILSSESGPTAPLLSSPRMQLPSAHRCRSTCSGHSGTVSTFKRDRCGVRYRDFAAPFQTLVVSSHARRDFSRDLFTSAPIRRTRGTLVGANAVLQFQLRACLQKEDLSQSTMAASWTKARKWRDSFS
jgi:hypothetical protein